MASNKKKTIYLAFLTLRLIPYFLLSSSSSNNTGQNNGEKKRGTLHNILRQRLDKTASQLFRAELDMVTIFNGHDTKQKSSFLNLKLYIVVRSKQNK